MSRLVTLKEGQTLSALCYEVYGDPLLVGQVARFNNLNGYRNIPAGMEILLPMLKKSIRIWQNHPSVNKDRVLSCSVYCNGTKLKDTYSLVSATVRLELNRIGKATLKFNAGNMDKQTFDESDDSLFKPGNTIRLDAGGVNKEETLFEGIIIGLRILAGKDFRSCMVVECRNNTYSGNAGTQKPHLREEERQ